jgi:hypothetical protein
MRVVDSHIIQHAASLLGQTGKFIINDSAIIFFPTAQQHNSIKSHGLTYEDDYRGNTMAGTFGSGRIDIRFHRDSQMSTFARFGLRFRLNPSLPS